MGEGWHNNHHRYMSSANQGFFWWEIDISFYVLKFLSWFGVVRELRTPPPRLLDTASMVETSQSPERSEVATEVL
jgi:stearoyl-CoA desaturase (delta-9 desaturase)